MSPMMVFAYLAIALLFALIFTVEVIAPASKSHCDRRWMILAGSLNIVQAAAALATGHLFGDWFSRHALLSLADRIDPVTGGVLTFLLASLIAYGWHRAAHRVPFLWRTFHQIHHSPRRIESLTAFFAHPLDAMAATFITCLSAYWLLGLTPLSAIVALLLVSAFNLYIHSDTRSPRWIGWFVQRPEMHRVHHQAGHHADNYGLPLWDLLFGTWKNPRERVRDCGFDAERERRIYDMLLMRDVHAD